MKRSGGNRNARRAWVFVLLLTTSISKAINPDGIRSPYGLPLGLGVAMVGDDSRPGNPRKAKNQVASCTRPIDESFMECPERTREFDWNLCKMRPAVLHLCLTWASLTGDTVLLTSFPSIWSCFLSTSRSGNPPLNQKPVMKTLRRTRKLSPGTIDPCCRHTVKPTSYPHYILPTTLPKLNIIPPIEPPPHHPRHYARFPFLLINTPSPFPSGTP
jgi:hypothetical protein